ncbi:hypothetical protein Q7C18_12965 [Nesterenkonia sp. CL21]|uniref:hypothetical protein n=1 Tax=Nesterenkonia sp. CL21 TaxID=3064894 RepID=UPI002879DF70|nr:hypothetical protein [Nesterenkonia sp. CL21]MDS2173615.1 hypothetical protein [Nesterenkonia sp. CL21]
MTDRSSEYSPSVTAPAEEHPEPHPDELQGADEQGTDEQIDDEQGADEPVDEPGDEATADDAAADPGQDSESGAEADDLEAPAESGVIGAEAAAHEITEPAQHEPAPSEPADPTSESDVTGPESAQPDDDGAARDSEAGPGTDTQPAVSSDTGEVRMSRPTPVLPPEARPEEKEAGLSEFFDTLDARFAAATEKLAHAFRRPEPGEQIAAPLDPRRAQGHVVDPDSDGEGALEEQALPQDVDDAWTGQDWTHQDWTHDDWPAQDWTHQSWNPQAEADPDADQPHADQPHADQHEPSVAAPPTAVAEDTDRPAPDAATDASQGAAEPEATAQDLPPHLEEDEADDVDLPDEQTASELDSYTQRAQEHPPLPTSDILPDEDATMVTLPPIDAQTGDPRTSRIPLPRPPKHDGRPLPWEAREQEAEETRLQDASAARRRAVIMEKAAAIEAATDHEDDDADEYADDEEDLYTYIPPYNLPSRDPDPRPGAVDLARQIFVSVSAVAALASALWMLGAFGGPAIIGGNGLETLVDGWYSGDAALLTPDAGHYWLWPVIALGLLGHAVHQWTTTQISTPRQRRSGWLVGIASVMMLVWTAAVHAGMLAVAVLAALAAALALVDAVRQFTLHTARNTIERRFTDSTVGLFTGWALVGAMSSVSAALTAMGVRIPGFPAILWAMIGLVVCIWIAAFYAMTERGRMTIALGLGWGMFWLVFPRLLSETPSVWVAIGAAMGAFVVILATESRRHRINHAERRAAMGRPVDDII